MIKEIYKLVEEAARKESNHFGVGAWTHHILSVVKYGKLLAEKLDADAEVVELAALLHDYSGIVDFKYYKEHHIHSARMAREVLEGFNYNEEKIKAVEHCILTHRGSVEYKRESLEAEIVASADALAHFDNFHSLLHLAFVEHRMNIDEGTSWALAKLERSWGKLMPEAKEIIEDKYKKIKEIFAVS